jgi:uncharacterized protein with von Willebrand factor type A (vWA) domain
VSISPLWSKRPRDLADRHDASTISLLVGFARSLRRAGVGVPVDSVVHYVRAIDALGIDRRDRVYWAGRAVLIHRHEDVATYDRIFDSFWWGRTSSSDSALPSPDHSFDEGGDSDIDTPSSDGDPPRRLAWVSYSDIDHLRRKDFAACSPEELEEVSRLLREMRVRATQRSRRMRRSRRNHGRHDTRATMRQTLRSGGEVVRVMRREPSARPRRVVLLCDVSGSMEPYARALLRFLHVAVAGQGRVEAFAVGTRLTRLTRQLSSRDPDAALRQAMERVLDWSGGTRLGEGIGAFNDRFGMPGMARGAIVVILSDGLDRGDPTLLAGEMARLHRAAHQTIWVNPLKASDGYEPLARGMAAALPHVDQFVEGHSAASLDALVGVIAASE